MSYKTASGFLKVFLTLCLFVLVTRAAYSFEAKSDSYRIQMGNFNYTSGEKSSENYWLHDTGGELSPGESNSTNYTVKAGFEYISTLIPFTFTISNDEVNFGTLDPEVPTTGTTDLRVTSGAAFGYKVTAQSSSPLINQSYPGVFIPHVSGDNSDITPLQEGDWANSATYGFGYQLANVISSDAIFLSGYRAFADESDGQDPVDIMLGTGITKESEVTVTYKVNVSPVQDPGVYQNIITYTATGTY